jgi:hypothetical protein
MIATTMWLIGQKPLPLVGRGWGGGGRSCALLQKVRLRRDPSILRPLPHRREVETQKWRFSFLNPTQSRQAPRDTRCMGGQSFGIRKCRPGSTNRAQSRLAGPQQRCALHEHVGG